MSLNTFVMVGDRITFGGDGRIALIRRGRRVHRVWVSRVYQVITTRTIGAS